jgi:hypothetical protein
MKDFITILIIVAPYGFISAAICIYIIVQIGKENAQNDKENHLLFIYKRKLCQTLKSQKNERSNQ